jgi:O-methyltransferase domain
MTTSALAEETGLPERSIYRLLRALASVGVFAELPDKQFNLTQTAAYLQTDVPGSLRATGIVFGEIQYYAWGSLLESLRTGRSSFTATFGTEFFPYLGAHPDLGALFQEMMAGLNVATNVAIPAAYDFSRFRNVVDVGGGNGNLLIAILNAYPTVRGVLFDLPQVREQAQQALEEAGLAGRADVLGGDFFTAVPAGGDAYLLRWILHDFDDERAARILRSCRTAISPEGRLLVVEHVITDEPASSTAKFQDLQMLLLLSGCERTETEFRDLFAMANFRLERAIPTASSFKILEAVPS